MTAIEFIMNNPLSVKFTKEQIIETFCPHEFGLIPNVDCENSTCQECWNRVMEEKR